MKLVFSPLFFLYLIALNGNSLSAQSDAPEFFVDFSTAGKEVPQGIGAGINDLSNASEGVWKAWSEAIRPEGGLARIWLNYTMGPMAKQVQAGLYAKEAGLKVFLVVVGAPENQGVPHERAGTPPKSVDAWAKQVSGDVHTLLKAGVPVEYVEIWNEPDLEGRWLGTMESFGAFFAKAGKYLRKSLPSHIRLGGPGMASGAGPGQTYFRALLKACAQHRFQPDFLSYHFYSSYPSDNECYEYAKRIQQSADEFGIPEPELILSEWNIDLPHPTAPECDDHRAGTFYISMNSSLARTSVSHSLFFFLQDGFWEAKKDYAGQSVGVFTLNGGPKAVLNGMRMFRKASQYPQVSVERKNAPWNLTCLATRSGPRGYLLLANAFGYAEKRAYHYVEWAGMDMSMYKGKNQLVRGFVDGKYGVERLGGPQKDQSLWEEGKRLILETRAEMSLESRPVKIEWAGGKPSVTGVWLLDQNHSNPLSNQHYLQEFKRWGTENVQRAVDLLGPSLKKNGYSNSDIAKAKAVMSQGTSLEMMKAVQDPQNGLDPRLVADIVRGMRFHLKEVRSQAPRRLAQHPGSELSEVSAQSVLKSSARGVLLDLPPWSSVLLELSWENVPEDRG